MSLFGRAEHLCRETNRTHSHCTITATGQINPKTRPTLCSHAAPLKCSVRTPPPLRGLLLRASQITHIHTVPHKNGTEDTKHKRHGAQAKGIDSCRCCKKAAALTCKRQRYDSRCIEVVMGTALAPPNKRARPFLVFHSVSRSPFLHFPHIVCHVGDAPRLHGCIATGRTVSL